MADKIFKFSLLNPFRWVPKNPVYDPRFNTRPFDDKIDANPFAGPYNQKWQTNDVTHLQFLSDYALTLKIYHWNGYHKPFGDTLYSTIAVTAVPAFPILGVTFTAYEATVDFHGFPEGLYYAEISYIDDTAVTRIWQSSPLDVKVHHPKTLLYEYWNTFNDKGVIFDTGIKFNMRIEGNIRAFTPSSLDQVFEDQQYNTTTENSIPYRTFQNFIGRAAGLPDWIIDKMNLIFSVNYKSIDGTFYNKTEGAKFEMVRPSQTEEEDGYMSIQVIQQDNFFLDQFTTGENPDTGDFKVITDAKIFDNVGASFSIAGIFTKNVNLIRIAIENKGLDTFTFKVGTSAGANDITEFGIDGEITDSLDIGYYFNAVSTVYITVPNGVNLKVTPVWEKYDAPTIAPITPGTVYPKGHMGMYYEVDPGDYDIHWAPTGIGNVGTPYEGCAVMGTNGLLDMTGAMPIGWDSTQPLTRKTFLGISGNDKLIAKNQLPAVGVPLISTQVNSSGGDVPTTTSYVARARNVGGGNTLNYELTRATVEPTLGLSANLGLGDPFNVTNYSLITVFFVKLTD
jgi:hypothetical protein